MIKEKYTPGPYTFNVSRLSDNSINVVHVLGPQGQGLAQIGVYGEAETLANAGMFAAAPDMLQTLVEIINECESGSGQALHQIIVKKARAAIRAALPPEEI